VSHHSSQLNDPIITVCNPSFPFNSKGHAKNGKQGAKNVPANPDVGTQAGLEHENDELRGNGLTHHPGTTLHTDFSPAAQVQALEAAANQVRLALEKDNETLRGS